MLYQFAPWTNYETDFPQKTLPANWATEIFWLKCWSIYRSMASRSSETLCKALRVLTYAFAIKRSECHYKLGWGEDPLALIAFHSQHMDELLNLTIKLEVGVTLVKFIEFLQHQWIFSAWEWQLSTKISDCSTTPPKAWPEPDVTAALPRPGHVPKATDLKFSLPFKPIQFAYSDHGSPCVRVR